MRTTSIKPLANSLLVFGLALGLVSGQARSENGYLCVVDKFTGKL
jgi:hypothetical protein